MTVSLVEFQGPASLVTCTRGGWRLTASVDENTQAGGRRLVQGQPVMVRLRLDEAHLFDGHTGKVLAAAGSG
jgi:hypothetical protein